MSTPGQSRHLAVGRSLPVYTQLRICRRAAIIDAMCQEATWRSNLHLISARANPLELLDHNSGA
jgi:hypothetical protein